MDADEVPLFRAPMRSHDDRVPAGAAVARGLELGLCGLGGRLPHAPGSLEEAVAAAGDVHDDRLARRVRRFADAPAGAFVWTRTDEDYSLGRLRGPWRYDETAGAEAADLVHVRDCEWRPVDLPLVPAGVRATFARGGRNWQRIRSTDAFRATERLWRLS